MCANARRPMDPGMARRLFAKSSRPQYCRPLQSPRLANQATNHNPAQNWIFQAFQCFCWGRNWVFEMFFQTGFCFVEDCLFASWIVIFLAPVPGRFHCPKGARCVSAPVALLVSLDNTALLIFFPSILLWIAWQKACQSASTSGAPHLSKCSESMKALCVPRQLVCSFPDGRLWKGLAELLVLDIDRSGAATQITHVHSTVIVRFDESSQPVHDASSASFVQGCYSALNQAITNFLRVRQQL